MLEPCGFVERPEASMRPPRGPVVPVGRFGSGEGNSPLPRCAALSLRGPFREAAPKGWRALHDPHDGGGYSGGTLASPALKRLVADIGAGPGYAAA